jgi:hypothetical protein
VLPGRFFLLLFNFPHDTQRIPAEYHGKKENKEEKKEPIRAGVLLFKMPCPLQKKRSTW